MSLTPKTALQALVLCLALLWIYTPVYHGQWVWDDEPLFLANPEIRNPGGLPKIWTNPSGPDYFPLTNTTFWMENLLWDLSPTGSHLVNILLHFAASLLLWRVFSRLGIPCAWLGALWFALHPLNVESVAWISERKNTLSLPLLLGSALAWITFNSSGCRKHYISALLLFLLAMLAKTSPVMFPFVLLLFAWWKHGRIQPRDLLYTSPFFLVSLGLGLTTWWFQSARAIGPESIEIGGALSRLAIAAQAIWFYLWKAFAPVSLLPTYPQWEADPAPLGRLILAWTGILVLTLVLWRKRTPWGRHGLFAWGFFILILVPILGFVPISFMRISWVADHFTYIPLASIAGILAALAGTIEMRTRNMPGLRTATALAAALLLSTLAFLSYRQAERWTDEETLWTYTLAHNPLSWEAHHCLGMAYMKRDQVAKALPHLHEAVRLRPDTGYFHNSLAFALRRNHQLDLALRHARKASELAPSVISFQLGHLTLLMDQNRLTEAEALFRPLLESHPDNASVQNLYGVLLLRKNDHAGAIKQFDRALALDPSLESAQINLKNTQKLLSQP